MSYKFTDVKEMVERKVVRSEMAQKLLLSQVSVFTKEIEIRTMYISLLQTMNKIEAMQLNEYSKEREDAINEIVVDLNTMDDGDQGYTKNKIGGCRIFGRGECFERFDSKGGRRDEL
jgi:secreted Zn-dependent insulinase-like peptidase